MISEVPDQASPIEAPLSGPDGLLQVRETAPDRRHADHSCKWTQ
jgi:hypothetical protein